MAVSSSFKKYHETMPLNKGIKEEKNRLHSDSSSENSRPSSEKFETSTSGNASKYKWK